MADFLRALGFACLCCFLFQEAGYGHGGQYQPPTSLGGPGDTATPPTATTGGHPSWHIWWARNRFQFLKFSTPMARTRFKGAFTPNNSNNNTSVTLRNSLRDESIELFRPFLKNRSFRIRSAACLGLSLLEDSESYSEIIALLKDPNQNVKDAALTSLAFMDGTKARHTLSHLARNTREAALTIDQTKAPSYFSGFAQTAIVLSHVAGSKFNLKHLALDPAVQKDVKSIALHCIGVRGDEHDAKFLLDYAMDEKNDKILLGTAVNALSKTNASFAYPCLLKFIKSKHMEVRRSAALGLWRHVKRGDVKTIELLKQTGDRVTDQTLKGFCLLSIGFIGGEEAIKFLIQPIKMGQTVLLPWACLGLGLALREQSNPEVEALLVKQLSKQGNRSTRSAAAIGLGLSGSKKAIPQLVECLKHGDDPFFRGYCAISLGLINEGFAGPYLKTSLTNDGAQQVIVQSAMALSLLNRFDAGQELFRLFLFTPNSNMKPVYAQCLNYMGDLNIAKMVLEKLKKDSLLLDDMTLSCCIRIIAKLCSGKTLPFLEPVAAHSNFADEYPVFNVLLSLEN